MSNFESRGKERSSSNLELHLNGNRKIGRIKKLEEVTQASGEDLFNGWPQMSDENRRDRRKGQIAFPTSVEISAQRHKADLNSMPAHAP